MELPITCCGGRDLPVYIVRESIKVPYKVSSSKNDLTIHEGFWGYVLTSQTDSILKKYGICDNCSESLSCRSSRMVLYCENKETSHRFVLVICERRHMFRGNEMSTEQLRFRSFLEMIKRLNCMGIIKESERKLFPVRVKSAHKRV